METKKQARPRFVATHSSSSSCAEITPDSSSSPPSPPSTDPRSNENLDVGGPAAFNKRDDTHGLDQSSNEAPPPKTKSVLNLTSSTLSGIYSPTGYDANRDDSATPWGTGTQTPARSSSVDAKLKSWKTSIGMGPTTSGDERRRRYSRRRSYQHPLPNHGAKQRSSYYTKFMFRTTVLFVLGIAYGDVVLHLHDTNKVAPVRIENINRSSRWYLAFWGLSSVILGSLVPWLDQVSNNRRRDASDYDYDPQEEKAKENGEFEDNDADSEGPDRNRNNLGADWSPIVRSIGAFVGIAFAIVRFLNFLIGQDHKGFSANTSDRMYNSNQSLQRRLPWQSTLQVSLTLATANPVIWYLIDRTRIGLFVASSVSVLITALFVCITAFWSGFTLLRGHSAPHATTVSDPSEGSLLLFGLVRYDTIGAATWISSVLFCSCVFFGNIGRRLPLG